LYHLALGLPFKVQNDSVKSYFDCKIKRLFIYAKKEEISISKNIEDV
jgi:hypothetical protein